MWVDASADQRLQRGIELGRARQRVDPPMRLGAVAAAPQQPDREIIHRGQHRPRPDGGDAQRQLRQVVQAIDGIAGEAAEQPVLHHRERPGQALLGRLEDEVDDAREVARLREVLRGAEQHGGVRVMAAGMHHAGRVLRWAKSFGLGHGQRIHVGAQADPAVPGMSALQHADHARAADARMHLDPQDAASPRPARWCGLSSKPSSGCAWMSRRQAVISGERAGDPVGDGHSRHPR
ncbi:hypothetical protein Ddc_24813 [Ditylenchus destructor]|nr:hypothetical protein Ddc_24813 [Ditylenchus destructor]